MKETIKTIIEWHEQTFPDATLEGQKKSLKKNFRNGQNHIIFMNWRTCSSLRAVLRDLIALSPLNIFIFVFGY